MSSTWVKILPLLQHSQKSHFDLKMVGHRALGRQRESGAFPCGRSNCGVNLALRGATGDFGSQSLVLTRESDLCKGQRGGITAVNDNP